MRKMEGRRHLATEARSLSVFNNWGGGRIYPQRLQTYHFEEVSVRKIERRQDVAKRGFEQKLNTERERRQDVAVNVTQ